MVFLKSFTPKDIIDKLIQYNYKELHIKYRQVAHNKVVGRKIGSPTDPILYCKIEFGYERIDLDNIPLKWVKVWNLLSYFEKKTLRTHPSNITEKFEILQLKKS